MVYPVANTQRIEKFLYRELGKEWDNRDRLFPLSEGNWLGRNVSFGNELRSHF
jgi:hypothetical protein